jgi:glycosyltransferase involved in cell wall biosynthesis
LKKLAILTTHPVQYYAPLFRLLAERGKIEVKVFYSRPPETTLYDKGFGREIEWDIPLLEGYEYEYLETGDKSPVSKYDPDAILVFGWSPPGHLQAMRHFHGRIPVWFRGDSTLLDERPGLRAWVRRLVLRWVYSHVDKAFYVGANNKAYYRALGLREEQLVFAPHAIDNERFADNEERQYEARARAWRRELGFSDDAPLVVFAGKFEPKKDPLLLIEAVRRIGPGVQLALVGSGELEPEVKAAISQHPNMRWLGFQNQSMMPLVYRLGDIFCLPSRGPGETWGLAVNEAMACARAVIASDRCGCAVDIVRPPFGRLFPAGNIDALTSALQYLATSDLKTLGAQAQSFIQDWSFSAQVATFELVIGDW